MSKNNLEYSNLNPLNTNLDKSLQYKRILNFSDLFTAGYGFIIGSGIFILLPIIIKISGGVSWLSFLIGCIVCLFTGLSYSKLNMIFPTNDAEYAWILNVLNFDKGRDPRKVHPFVKFIANIVIWIIFFIGIFTSATILASQSGFIKEYINIDENIIKIVVSIIPVIINIFGAKTTIYFNKVVIFIISIIFAVIFKYALTDGEHFRELTKIKSINNVSVFNHLLNSSFITMFLYNGFQSLVQLSEEAKNQNDIPKSLISSLISSAVIYSLFAISVIALLGSKVASKSKMSLIDAFKVVLSEKKTNIINIIIIIIITNTVLIISLSRSRLLQKMSVRGIAPSIFKSLGSKEIKKETFNSKSYGDNEKTNPVNAIIGVGIITYFTTFIKKGAVESLSKLTSIFILITFLFVNILVIVFHFKKKTIDENERYKFVDKEIPYLKGLPWYSFIGILLSLIYLIKFSKFKN